MIPRKILRAHYREYAKQPNEWVENMEATKKSIVRRVLSAMRFQPLGKHVKIAVLGASDKRYIPIHRRIFTRHFPGRTVRMATLDIDKLHLAGQHGVIEHNVTRPLPEPSHDVIFSHELMKFLTPQEQLLALKQAYAALSNGGLAMHIIHSPSIKGTTELKDWQFRVDPDALIKQLKTTGIKAKKMEFESKSKVPWLRETTVIVTLKRPK